MGPDRSPAANLLLGWIAAFISAATLAQAQQPQVPEPVTLTAEAVASHLAVLAADSFQRRATPSPALERTARYIAAQWTALGLLPGDRLPRDRQSEDTTWLQRYPLPGQRRLDCAAGGLSLRGTLTRHGRPVLTESGVPATLGVSASFARTARVISSMAYPSMDDSHLVLLAGRHDAASLRRAAREHGLARNTALYIPPRGTDSVTVAAMRAELAELSLGLLVVSTADSATFAAQVAAAQAQPPLSPDQYMVLAHQFPSWAVELWPDMVRDVLHAVDLDLTALQADTTPIARTVPVQFRMSCRETEVPPEAILTAPNVLGTLLGSDSALQREYVVVAAPMDELGPRADSLDTADNVTGLAGLVELARALSRPEARPRRSVVFVGTSGERHDAWGSRAFALEHLNFSPPRAGAGALMLELGGRPRVDSVPVVGLGDFAFSVAPPWTAAMHAELGVTLTDGGTVFAGNSGAEALARAGLSSLALVAPQSPPVAGPAAGDAAAARLLRLVYYLVQDLANAPAAAPRRTELGRRRSRSRP